MERLDQPVVPASVSTVIVRQLTDFAPWLRRHGFRVGTPETLLALSSLLELDLDSMQEVCVALRAVYSRSSAEWAVFPNLFERYFCGRGVQLKETQPLQVDDAAGRPVAGHPNPVRLQVLNGLFSGYHPDTGERFTLLAAGQELRKITAVTKLWVQSMDAPPGRQWRLYGRKRIDLRQTIRSALRQGGEPFVLKMRRRQPDKPRIVLALDISGSMKAYAPFLTALAWSFTRVRAYTQIFLFSTKLLRVTSLVTRNAVTGIPISNLSGLQGGTRIGDALHQLLQCYPNLLQRHTYVLIASDGFDAGHPERLHTSMRDLRSRVGRVVWINPLLGEPGYEPTSTGMSLALPYIDAFVDVHDLASWQTAVKGGC